jgi:Family of unknown function (DUF5695)
MTLCVSAFMKWTMNLFAFKTSRLLAVTLALAAGPLGRAMAEEAVPQQSGPEQSGAGMSNTLRRLDQAQENLRGPGNQNRGSATLGLEGGTLDLDTPDFNLKLVKDSQTIAALQPKGGDGFDFTPADQLQVRAGNRYYHLGDLTIRLRKGDTGEWRNYSTAVARQPVKALPTAAPVLAAADLSPTLAEDCPLQVRRTWALEDGRLVLRFEVKNKDSEPVQIGSLGIPMIFNNLINDFRRTPPRPRSLEQAHAICSFSDPAICLDGGYIQVTRLSGRGPALVIVPDGRTPFEAYNPILNPNDRGGNVPFFADLTERGQTFEGFYEWLVHSKAYAENEWKNAQPWNAPTSETLAPGATKTFGVKFLVAPEIRDISKVLAAAHRPVAIGIPGYILPMDLDGRLFLNYSAKVASIEVEPKGAIVAGPDAGSKPGWQAYTLHGKEWGRARVTVNYEDGLKQTIHYTVIKPSVEAVADLGNFLFTKQWFDDPTDPFHRSPSVMTYDRANNRIVTQDGRVWIAGLQDEGGSGSWVAAAMKLSGQPKKEEVAKFERFVDGVLWGGIQYTNGPWQYGVRKSMFYYEPNEITNYYRSDITYRGWTAWNKRAAERVDRAYNYPHVVAAYWTMYHVARNYAGLATHHSWDWYLEQAYQTTKFLGKRSANGQSLVGYIDTGLMEGDIFVLLVKDLKREGWKEKADELEAIMKRRADVWKGRAYPFGSEMAWDSTGQEEVYAWTKYFGYDDKGQVSISSILGYMPTVPHWGYNGNARRYWDFFYGAAPGGRLERQIHHYGSGINAIPLLSSYRDHPDDYYLLLVGYGGAMGALSNIDPDGFAAAAFHSSPALLKWDSYSGDYGPNFFGHAVNAATYVINHPEFGWQSFGGNVAVSGDWIKVRPRDSFRQRIYVAPRGLWLTLDAGTFESIEVNTKTHAVRVEFSSATPAVRSARLRVEQPAKVSGVGTYRPTTSFNVERDAFICPLNSRTAWVELTDAG